MPNPHSQSVSHVSTHARALLRIIVLHTHIADTPGQPRSTGLAQTDIQAARKRDNKSQPKVPGEGGDHNRQDPEHLGLDGHAADFSLAWLPSYATGVPFCRASTRDRVIRTASPTLLHPSHPHPPRPTQSGQHFSLFL